MKATRQRRQAKPMNYLSKMCTAAGQEAAAHARRGLINSPSISPAPPAKRARTPRRPRGLSGTLSRSRNRATILGTEEEEEGGQGEEFLPGRLTVQHLC